MTERQPEVRALPGFTYAISFSGSIDGDNAAFRIYVLEKHCLVADFSTSVAQCRWKNMISAVCVTSESALE